jgi:hypothetical protein
MPTLIHPPVTHPALSPAALARRLQPPALTTTRVPEMTNHEIMAEIGKRLARRRRELDLSLAGVAERCGVSLQQIHKYETAQSVVSAPMLWRLSQCLDTPIAAFFEGLESSRNETSPRPGG